MMVREVSESILRIGRRIKFATKGVLNLQYPKINLASHLRRFEEDEFLSSAKKLNCFVSWKSTKLTRSHGRAYLSFIEKNKDVQFWIFDDKRQDAWMQRHFSDHPILRVYKGIRFSASKTDIFRLCLLYRYGGVYTGINRVFEVKLTDIYPDRTKFLISFEKNYFGRERGGSIFIPTEYRNQNVIQHTLFSPAGHKILELSINKIVAHAPSYNNVVFKSVKQAIWDFSAPYLLTRVVDEYLDTYGTSKIEFCDYQFGGKCKIPIGAEFRYAASPSYLGSKNMKILSIPSIPIPKQGKL